MYTLDKIKNKEVTIMALYPEYQRLIDSGEYSSVEEMCNRLCLNYDDVYDYSDEEEDD